MHLTPRTFGPDQEPSVGWRLFLAQQLNEEILSERARRLVLIYDVLDLRMVLNIALEEVEGGVITVENRILQVLFHCDFKFAARVARPDRELSVCKSFDQSLYETVRIIHQGMSSNTI